MLRQKQSRPEDHLQQLHATKRPRQRYFKSLYKLMYQAGANEGGDQVQHYYVVLVVLHDKSKMIRRTTLGSTAVG